jgi:hypothetical protein
MPVRISSTAHRRVAGIVHPDSKLQLERNSMPCDAGRMQLTAELAGHSAG